VIGDTNGDQAYLSCAVCPVDLGYPNKCAFPLDALVLSSSARVMKGPGAAYSITFVLPLQADTLPGIGEQTIYWQLLGQRQISPVVASGAPEWTETLGRGAQSPAPPPGIDKNLAHRARARAT
jgi:hypothetical protein